MKCRIKITLGLMLFGMLGFAFVCQHVMFNRLQHEISEARASRMYSLLLADELRRACDELTLEMRLYEVTMDPRFKSRFEELAEFRAGRNSRRRNFEQSVLAVLSDEGMLSKSGEEPLSFTDMADRAGFSESEYAILGKARRMADQLIEAQRSTMRELESGEDAAGKDRLIALESLVDGSHHSTEAEIRVLLRNFEERVGERTGASIAAASLRSARIRRGLIGLGLLLVGLTFWGLLVEVVRAARYEERSRRDALTQTANRACLNDHLHKVTANAEAHGEIVLLAFIDLNGFKRINDRLGHRKGDEMLRAVAACLRDECRARDLIVRYGGDEFVVVFVAAMNQRRESIARLKRTIEAAFTKLSGMMDGFEIGASVGISVFPCPAPTVDVLIQKADEAMYRAKKEGGSFTVCIHEEQNGSAIACPDPVSDLPPEGVVMRASDHSASSSADRPRRGLVA